MISVVVFCHEFGHFYFARLYGIKVEKFSIGFGPVIFKHKDQKGTQWILSAIPLGGYVKLHGDDLDPSFADPVQLLGMSKEQKDKYFCYKPLKQQAIVVVAGPVFNYVLAFICFFIVFMIIGIPTLDSKIAAIQEKSVAAAIGLQKDDVILEVDNKKISSGEDFKHLFRSGEEEVLLKILRNEEEFLIRFTLPFEKKHNRILGVVFAPKIEESTIIGAFKNSTLNLYFMSKMMIFNIFDMVTGKISLEHIGGPIKIAKYSAKAAANSLTSLIWFIAVISLNLGLVNLLPIPMLDGGRLFFYFIEAINGKPMKKSVKIIALRTGFIILILLMMIAISNDIRSLL